jgi:acetyltransferase-like isoleucine patch superfamily enzyme
MGFPIIGTSIEIKRLNDENTDFVIGIGNNATRKLIAEKYDVNFVTLVHPSAQIGVNVSIGKGTVVMVGAVINPCSSIGEHCIINTRAVIEHDNVVENYEEQPYGIYGNEPPPDSYSELHPGDEALPCDTFEDFIDEYCL